MKAPKKKREATPKASKVSRASVDAPPAVTPEKVAAWRKKHETGETKDQRNARMFAQLSDKSDTAPADIPEELETVWDKDIAAGFQSLRPQQQDFLLAYLRTGNGAEAYRQAYNKLASDHLASVAGSRLVASVGIEPILAKFASYKTEALFTVVHGYREMAQATKPEWVQDKAGQWENVGDAPDWAARKEAYLGIRKVHGLDQPAEVKHSGDVMMTHKYDIPNKRPIGQ